MGRLHSRRDPGFELQIPSSTSNQLQVPLSPSRSISAEKPSSHKTLFFPRKILCTRPWLKEKEGPPFVFPQKVYHKIGPPVSRGKLSRACPPRGVKPEVRPFSIFGTNLLNQACSQKNPPPNFTIPSATLWAFEPRQKRWWEVHP